MSLLDPLFILFDSEIVEADKQESVSDSLTIERLLTQAGLRLAATLNTVFREVAIEHARSDGSLQATIDSEAGPLNLGWLMDY